MNRMNKMVEQLILRCSDAIDNSLYYGKMGVLICLYEYARYTNKRIYAELADILLEEVIEELDCDMSVSFASGLCGIGWGIGYSIGCGYIVGNADEVLEAIDGKIMEVNVSKIEDCSIKTGLGGIAYYVWQRMTSDTRTKYSNFPFDMDFLHSWMVRLPLCMSMSDLSVEEEKIFNNLQQVLYRIPRIAKVSAAFPTFIFAGNNFKTDAAEASDLRFLPVGLGNGIAGIILKEILS